MNHKEVKIYRGHVQQKLEEISLNHVAQTADIAYIKETVDDVKVLLKEQNARIRTNESAISKIQGIGSVLSLIFGGFIAWLFKSIK